VELAERACRARRREGVGERPELQTRITATAGDDTGLRQTCFSVFAPGSLPGARKACLGLADAVFRRILSASSAALFAIP
jgi:hypothetical protein